ncbi:MAG: hypothetical protein M0Q13_09785 [Methanothrix sp.]|jgi:hypothetical protein|nr:hypothetical protein [Methanothrix sp.]
MDSMENALLKAGFKKSKKEEKPKIIIPKLDKEECKIFNQMHQDPKRRKFLLHLVHAFLPNDKENNVSFIWSWNKVKGERKCVMCEQNIISLADAYIKVNEQINNYFKVEDIMINSNDINVFSKINKNIDTLLFNIFSDKYFEAFNNKVSGIYSNKSKVFMCSPCYKIFNDWVSNMLLRKHKDFRYVIGDKIKL